MKIIKAIVSVLVVTAVGLSAQSCKQKETTKALENKIGKYVYKDDNNIYHLDSYCSRLRHGKDEYGHEIYAKHPIDTAVFTIDDYRYVRVCARCVDDAGYEYLLNLSKRNYGKYHYSE